MNEYTKNTKRIFTRRLAVFLRRNGCKIIRTEVNFKKPEHDVYVFEDTDRLQDLITDFQQRKL